MPSAHRSVFLLRPLLRLAVFLCTALALSPGRAQSPVVPAGTRFVMSHFRGNSGGGDERLHISISPDGVHWTALNNGNPVWQPPERETLGYVVRDPSIIYDNGTFWVAFTSGGYGRHASFGLVKSTNLLDWTFVGEINTAIPGATDPFTWNPCFFRDGDGMVHVFVSISPINGSTFYPIPALRTYELHPVSADWTQWSSPALVELPSSNTNEFWAWKEGDVYHAIYVDFRSNAAWIHVTSRSLLTGWTQHKRLGYDSQEGGFVLKRPDGGYRLFLERGNGSGPQETYYFFDFNSDFGSATAAQPFLSSIGMRNGKIAAMPFTTSMSAWQAQFLAGLPAAQQSAAADPDDDGMSNLLEMACGSDPKVPAKGPHSSPSITWDGAFPTLRLKYRRLPSISGISWDVQRSGGLSGWDSTTDAVRTVSTTLLTDGTEEVVAGTATPLSPSEFLRLKVTQTAP
jgi:hypothetical protein